MDKLAAMRIFALVAEHHSLAAAARLLDVSPSAISKHIASLEAELGAQLLIRTTRKVALSEVGAAYLERCHQILADIDSSEDIVRNASGVVQGLLRVESPPGFAHRHIAPHLPVFTAQYPHISVELIATDRPQHLVDGGIDISIRIVPLADLDGLAYTELAPNHRQLVATQTYLDRHGVPATHADLATHQLVTQQHDNRGNLWHFKTETGETKTFKARGNIIMNNGDATLRAVLNHGGIAMLPSYISGRHVREGKLVPVLNELLMEDYPIHAVTSPTQHHQPKIDVFLSFLTELYGAEPYWLDRSATPSEAALRASL